MIPNKINVVPAGKKANNLYKPHRTSIENKNDNNGKRKSMAESIKNLVVIKYYKTEFFLHLKSLFGILILILTVATTTLVTCLPHHNAIVHPEYWYESLYFLSIALAPLNSAKIIVEANMLLSKEISIKAMIKSVIISLIGMNGTYMVIYTMWVHLLQYRFPIPFGFQITGLLHSVFVTPLSIWILYPSSVFKEDASLCKRMIAFICMILLRLIIGVAYNKFPALFSNRPPIVQWILVFFLPVVKKSTMWLHQKVVFFISSGDEEKSKIDTIVCVGCVHSFAITHVLGSSHISASAAYFLMLSDFLLNAWTFLMILKRHLKETTASLERQNTSLKYLALKEFKEIFIPLAYSISFIIAYFGPSAELIGNVKSDIWMFERVENLTTKFNNIALFLVIDGLRGIMFGAILWRVCKLNMYRAYVYIIENYGILILSIASLILNMVNDYSLTNSFLKSNICGKVCI